MKSFFAIGITAVSSLVFSTPSNAQYYNGYGGGSYFGGGNTRPPSNVIQRGNGYGGGDYFGMPRTNSSPSYSSPNYRNLGVRDCSKYINC